MSAYCPHCQSTSIVKNGHYLRSSDSKSFQRYKCRNCQKTFSEQIFKPDYRLKRRRVNSLIFRLLAGGMSQREIALTVGISKNCIARRVVLFGLYAKQSLECSRRNMVKASEVLFDEMESFEHTKCKPVTIAIGVEEKSRKILGLDVGTIAAKGHLAKISRAKYGPRACERKKVLASLVDDLKQCTISEPIVKTDQSKHYSLPVAKAWLGKAKHKAFKGVRGAITGQGEMKRTARDPLFTLNHTYAMIRDKVKRLSRRTWCTTKKLSGLECLLYIYAHFHNQRITGVKRPKLVLSTID